MAKRKQSRGECAFCGREMTKAGMTRHLPACPEYKKAIEQASGKTLPIFHLRVQDAWLPDYWLHLEMKGTETLAALDRYLRAIWLECCGHLSQFSIDGWRGEEIPMRTPIARVFEPDVELTHIYDFGTSSETLIKTLRVREGPALTNNPIVLMARNNLPEIPCMECDRPASWLCLECLYELDEPGTLCDEHVKDHPHDTYGEPMPIYNSPRVGMCGYDGPALPPY